MLNWKDLILESISRLINSRENSCFIKTCNKSFGENVIVEHTDAEIDRGDKIALIGANGKGKSTIAAHYCRH